MITTRTLRISSVATLTAFALAGALALQPALAGPAKKEPTLTITVLPGQVRLVPGESVRVRLTTNVTTGYSWAPRVLGSKASVTVSEGVYAGTSTLVGAPGRTTWTITAVRPGRAVVRFLATPPGGGTPVNDGTLTVIVR